MKRLDQALTYAGLLEGAPIRPMNERMLAPLRKAARSRGTFLIEPVIRTVAPSRGGWNLGGHYPEFLPGVRITMALHAVGGANAMPSMSTSSLAFAVRGSPGRHGRRCEERNTMEQVPDGCISSIARR